MNGDFQTVANAVVLVETNKRDGSGVVVADHFVLTCQHVVSGVEKVAVRYGRSKAMRGQVVQEAKDLDLALIHVPGLPLDPIDMGTDEPPVYSEIVVCSSPTPFLAVSERGTYQGLYSVEGRRHILFTSPTELGSSGGALADLDGCLFGLICASPRFNGLTSSTFGYGIRLRQIDPFLKKAIAAAKSRQKGKR